MEKEVLENGSLAEGRAQMKNRNNSRSLFLQQTYVVEKVLCAFNHWIGKFLFLAKVSICWGGDFYL